MTKGNLALQMPSSYVLMDEEEMMYVEGGAYNLTYTQTRSAAINILTGLGYEYHALGELTFVGLGALSTLGKIAAMVASGASGVAGSIVYQWGTAYLNAAQKCKKLTSTKVKIHEYTTAGMELHVSVSKA